MCVCAITAHPPGPSANVATSKLIRSSEWQTEVINLHQSMPAQQAMAGAQGAAGLDTVPQTVTINHARDLICRPRVFQKLPLTLRRGKGPVGRQRVTRTVFRKPADGLRRIVIEMQRAPSVPSVPVRLRVMSMWQHTHIHTYTLAIPFLSFVVPRRFELLVQHTFLSARVDERGWHVEP